MTHNQQLPQQPPLAPQALSCLPKRGNSTSGKSPGLQQAVAALQKSKINSVAVSGDTAKATTTISIAGKTTTIAYQAQRIAGKWLISCCLGTGGAP
jgi:hypothetical protein